MTKNDLFVQGCRLVGGGDCPEQYDVFIGDFQLGYLRMRGGGFTASLYEVFGDRVFSSEPKGYGRFKDDERFRQLYFAVEALIDAHNNKVIENYEYNRED